MHRYQGYIHDVGKRYSRIGSRLAYIASVVHVLRVPSGRNRPIGRNAIVNGVDTSEGVDIYFQVGQGDIGAWLERCGITSRGGVKEVDRGENGVRINSRATTTSIGGKVTACRVFVGLDGRSAGDADGRYEKCAPVGNTKCCPPGYCTRKQRRSDQAPERARHLPSMTCVERQS